MSFADGDFCQNEKHLINLLCKEFEIDQNYLDSLVEQFSKKAASGKSFISEFSSTKSSADNTSSSEQKDSSDLVSKGMKLNKTELNSVFDIEEKKVHDIVYNKVKENIKDEIGISDFKISINDVKIKVNRLVADSSLMKELLMKRVK